MMMTTASVSCRCVTSSENIYTLICHDFPKKYFLICTWNTEIKACDDSSRPRCHKLRTTNVSQTNKCYDVIIVQCMSNNILWAGYNSLKHLWQLHCSFIHTKDNRSVRSDIQVLLFFPCMTIPWLICCCEEVILSVVDHWWWPSIPLGPIICTCRSCFFSLSFRNLWWCCNVNCKISMPFFSSHWLLTCVKLTILKKFVVKM